MHASAESTDGTLRSALSQAFEEADKLLGATDSPPLDAVVWLSAHIAAFEHAVYPAIRKALPDAGELIAVDRGASSRLAKALRIMERRHSGDVLASGLSSERLTERIADLVRIQKTEQALIVSRLEQTLDDAATAELVESYAAALSHAPTRPHPHLSHGSLMFHLDAMRDKLLDTMDGRHVPIPRVSRRRITPGRWGNYFLGHPQDDTTDTG
jgi:hypothetical protein